LAHNNIRQNWALLEENKKLKQQLKTAEMEREFLKKAAAYFAKENQ
jgi:transposase